ncbi:MAG: hypothetical protein KAS32_08070, partial [Candidatus Peribacteraceae bacterium]|nr:hypothetical protein [Candidatus Peribacteraceae bacterium]
MEFCIGSKVFVDWNKSNNYLKDKYPEFVEITDKVVGDKIYYYCKVNDNTYAWFKEDWIIIEKGFMIPFGEAEPKFKVGDRVKIDWDEI